MSGSSVKVAYLSVLCAAAIILSYIESMLPIFTVPGMKLGLANLAVVTALYLYSWREALTLSAVRVVCVGLLFGNLFSLWFSMAGGMFSLLCMVLVKKTGYLDLTGVSMVGGIAHNIGQIIVAMIVVENARVAYYFIPLAITGIVTGILIGLLSRLLINRLRKAMDK